MSLSETGVGIGKMHENGALDVGGDAYIDGLIQSLGGLESIITGVDGNTPLSSFPPGLSMQYSGGNNIPSTTGILLTIHSSTYRNFQLWQTKDSASLYIRYWHSVNSTWSSWYKFISEGEGRIDFPGASSHRHGSVSFGGSKRGYAGISFPDANAVFMMRISDRLSGLYYNNSSWVWQFDSTGKLAVGSVPYSKIVDNDSGWLNLSLSGATAYSTGLQPRYRKVGDTVFLEGEMKLTSSLAAGGVTAIGTLPSGYRPPRNNQYICQGSGNAIWLFAVNSNGTCEVGRYRNGDTSASISTSTWLPFAVSFAV
jgi:hypothetical protein